MNASLRTLVDTASWAPREGARRCVEPSDVVYALERRPRQGWQTLARQLGVNAVSLQRACETPLAPIRPPGAAPAAKPARRVASAAHVLRLKPASAEADVLRALAVGCRKHDEVVARAGVTVATSRDYVGRLKSAGLVDGRDADGRWKLTLTGWAEVAALTEIEEKAGG